MSVNDRVRARMAEVTGAPYCLLSHEKAQPTPTKTPGAERVDVDNGDESTSPSARQLALANSVIKDLQKYSANQELRVEEPREVQSSSHGKLDMVAVATEVDC